MIWRLTLLFIYLVFFQHVVATAQPGKKEVVLKDPPGQYPDGPEDFYLLAGDSTYIMRGVCKNINFLLFQKPVINTVPVPITEDEKALRIHGNILYDFSYRSYIDTPFAQRDLMMHMVQTRLYFNIREKYPVLMTVTNRNANSKFFRNYTDVSFQFNQLQLLNNIKSDLQKKLLLAVKYPELENAERTLLESKNALKQLQTWITNPARVQEIISEKEEEEKLKKSSIGFAAQADSGRQIKDSLEAMKPDWQEKEIDMRLPAKNKSALFIPKDSALNKKGKDISAKLAKRRSAIEDSSSFKKYSARRKDYEKLKDSVQKLEAKIEFLRKGVKDSITKLKTEISHLKTSANVDSFIKKNKLPGDVITRKQRVLMSVNQFDLGRFSLDYSELTVKNTSLTGGNIEMNPGRVYLAFAAGKINYRFRDFIYSNNTRQPSQSLFALRGGMGRPDGNNIIATIYSGNKQVLNTTSAGSTVPLQRIMGISLESKINLGKNSWLVAEIAKSSYVTNSTVRPTSSELLGKVFDLKTHTNEAYSVKVNSNNPATNTKLTGYFKKTGENFQSFNLYPFNLNQNAWMVKLSQGFWKNRVLLDAAIRKNDFSNPAAMPDFSNQNVFKSLQATLRFPKYPFISAGFYPSSQLTIGNGNTLMESQYNTLNIIMSHTYNFKRLAMNTNGAFTKFYNSGSDRGFIYYNASSFLLTQTVYFLPFTLQTTAGITDQQDLHLFSLEQQFTCQFKNKFSATAGIKWNRLNHHQDLFGSIAAINLYIGGIGSFQFSYNKTYLPDMRRTLVPVDIGRMSFFREF